jgi:hypothetical protein
MEIISMVKLAKQVLENVDYVEHRALLLVKLMKAKYKCGIICNYNVQIILQGDDFIKGMRTMLITADYFRTPRILRNCPKKQRNFLNRYI